MSQYLRYAVYECRHVVSNELQLRQVVTAITLTPVRHKHHMQIFFLNFWPLLQILWAGEWPSRAPDLRTAKGGG